MTHAVPVLLAAAGLLGAVPPPALAAPSLIGSGNLTGDVDRSGLTGTPGGGVPNAVLGAFGSDIAYTGRGNE